MTLDIVADLNHALDSRDPVVRGWLARYSGQTTFAFLTQAERDKLAHRIRSLSINFGGLAVDLLAERLRLTGFTVNGTPDLALWEAFNEGGMDSGALAVMTEALAVGQGFVSVWADEYGDPVALPETATQCIVKRDPVTRRAVAGLKRWADDDSKAHAVLYLPDALVHMTSKADVPVSMGGDGIQLAGAIPPTGWVVTDTVPNPLGVVPVVALDNPGSLIEAYGRSELAPLADLCDALEKIMLDGLIASHETGTARRWVTGSIEVDPETGEGIDPWSEGTATMQVENPEAKIGQLQAADLGGFDTLAGLVIRQLGALSAVPPQALGLSADMAMSADAIRAAEASLTARAESRQRAFGRAWAQVGALMVAVRDSRDLRGLKVKASWADPSTRSEAQEADAAAKLYGANLLSREGTLERLGYGPDEIAAESRREAREAALRLAAAPVVAGAVA